MNLIQCSEICKYQIDGYCSLEKCGLVSSTEYDCPYFVELSLDKRNSFSQTANTDKL